MQVQVRGHGTDDHQPAYKDVRLGRCGLIGLQKIAGENCEESIRTILRIAEPGNAARRWDISDAARARKQGSEAFRISSAFDGICLPTDHMVAVDTEAR